MRSSRIYLLAAVSAVLAVVTAGCCSDVEDTDYKEDFEGEIVGEELASARGFGTSDEERCEYACLRFLARDDLDWVVVSCDAVGAAEYADKPWDPENTLTTVTCTARVYERVFCT